jgi:putative peptidoglycan lipid II flippase
MGALLALITSIAPSDQHGLLRLIVLAAEIAAGLGAYGLLLAILGVTSWREALSALRRPDSQHTV